jgi:hypothetical protein
MKTRRPWRAVLILVGTCSILFSGVSSASATPSIATTASPNITLGAGTLTDSATVSGRVSPVAGATVDFRLYGPNDATCTGAPAAQSLNVPYPVAGGAVTSTPPFAPTQAGTYRWVASYSGDANNVPVTGACGDAGETTVVARATPSIATTASPNITLGAGTLTDSATVSGRVSPLAGATIDFRLYGPNNATCTGAPAAEFLNVPYPVAGGAVTSAPPFPPTQAGTYRWVASYSGDANNMPVTGACGAPNESVVVSGVTPTLTTRATGPVSLGGQIADTAILGGATSPTGTITFKAFGPDDATCSRPPAFTSAPKTVTGNGTYTSDPFTPTIAGTYRWTAAYSGGGANEAKATACNDPGESVLVSPRQVAVGKLTTSLTLNAKPRRDRRLPFRYRFSGSVKFPAGINKAVVCGGTVKLRLRKGTKTVAKGTAAVSKGCTYKKTITIRSTRRTGTKKGKLKVAATFGGHTYLKSSKRSTTVRFF